MSSDRKITPSLISREQALCMFYVVDYTEENVQIYSERVEAMEGLKLVYMETPLDPVLMSIRRINCNPFRIHYYLSRQTTLPPSGSNEPSSSSFSPIVPAPKKSPRMAMVRNMLRCLGYKCH